MKKTRTRYSRLKIKKPTRERKVQVGSAPLEATTDTDNLSVVRNTEGVHEKVAHDEADEEFFDAQDSFPEEQCKLTYVNILRYQFLTYRFDPLKT